MSFNFVPFGSLYAEPVRNGLTRPTSVRGDGYRMVNMGELFAFDRIGEQEMERVQLNERELQVATLEEGDLLFARSSLKVEGTGKCSFVQSLPEVTTFESHLIRARLDHTKADPRFYYYFFKSYLGRATVLSIAKQVGAAGLPGSKLAGLSVPQPVPTVQSRIADILSTYDDMIENNRRRMALLEGSVQQLYSEWFIRLSFPGHEHTRITDGVPEGWERAPVPDAIAINPQTKLSNDDEHWWVKMADLDTNSMVIQNAIKKNGRNGSKFKNGDTLFARITPCLENGKTAFVNFMMENEVGRGSTEFIVLRSIKLTPEFVYCLARTYDFRENAIKSMIGASGRQRVQESCFDKYLLLVPPRSILVLFNEFVQPAFEQIKNLHAQNEKLRTALDLLLPKLVSGEIIV